MHRHRPFLEHGRDAFQRRAWREAYDALAAARATATLAPPDLWLLAQSAYLVGRDDEFIAILKEAERAHRDADEPVAAARCAFWIGFHLANESEHAAAAGWFGRATRLLEEAGGECVEQGYLMLPDAHRALAGGEPAAAAAVATRAAAMAQRFDDRDLLALALHLEGRALLRQRRVPEGLALLDEAMVAVAGDELSPTVTGLVYCSVISACREVHALGRSHAWTAALSQWCERQPEMVPYAGECGVYRSEILQLRGAWNEAAIEAARAAAQLARAAPRALALYQQGEVHRLRGEFAAAEQAYRAAAAEGGDPQPGLALLRLEQGERDAALAAIRRALAEAREPLRRARLLPAAARIAIEAGDLDEATDLCDELTRIAEEYASPTLEAQAAQERGALALASGDAAAALPPLRHALDRWQQTGAPYETARVRIRLGIACRELGDDDGASLEFDTARAELERLGAAPELSRLDALSGRRGGRSHGLTPRQRQVLALLATGRTNREIAERLFISENTVARHVADIFRALGVSSRSAATAYAHRHDLLRPPT